MSERTCKEYEAVVEALIDGAPDEDAKQAFLAHAAGCPACRREYQWYVAACADLEAVGDAFARRTPGVDLVAAVMAALPQVGSSHPGVVPFPVERARRRRTGIRWFAAAAVAAAAVLVVSVWIWGYRTGEPGRSRVAQVESVAPPAGQHPAPGAPAALSTGRARLDDAQELVPRTAFIEVGKKPGPEPDSLEEAKALDLKDVLAARCDAVTDPRARSELVQWASLSMEKARNLVAAAGTPVAAQIGASTALPPAEAEGVLLAAAAAMPADPYVRYQLASAYAAQPQQAARAYTEYAAVAAQDPENSLPYYQQALYLFSQGDVEGALAALGEARSLESASAYGLEAAAYAEQALVAAGIDPEVARLLTSMTAGSSQYTDLTSLSSRLLELGRYYEQAGNPDVAQQIYESVRTLGNQVAAGASLSSEQLAGLDIERSAVDALSGLIEFIQAPGNYELLAEQTQYLVGAFGLLGEFLSAVNNFFLDNSGNLDLVRSASDFIMQNGDLGLLSYLYGNP